ncbi:photosystem II core complex proteins psbY, chloroplastic [Cucumis sativus]|uniref:Photosystem II core complex proteins psbY n=1 Tax=Cucumis sativus TaxID=3659 RepID=A0A0A0LKA1_CUCSA|nr:photosystem II core complex proteins psbY, chloroplastic [Cucumis sativus]
MTWLYLCLSSPHLITPNIVLPKPNLFYFILHLSSTCQSPELSSTVTSKSTSMAATMATMAVLSVKCTSINSTKTHNTQKIIPKPISLLSLQNLPKGLISSKSNQNSNLSTFLSSTAIAGAVFATLGSSDPAFAAQQIAEIAADGDNRGLALLLPLIPAVAWVLFNILQPALNQINRMRSDKGVIIGLGLGGLTASGFMYAPDASASEIAMIADASSSDSRGQLLLFVVAPAILWVLYNILQPALNQLNRMRSE